MSRDQEEIDAQVEMYLAGLISLGDLLTRLLGRDIHFANDDPRVSTKGDWSKLAHR